jgi:hypothetical protein
MRKASVGFAALLALALAARVAQADPVEGPASKADVVDAYTTNVYHESFFGGELARVRVIGDGDTDLDVYVLDEFGNVIASDTGYTDTCEVVWLPRWTGPFTIRVVNLGAVYNRYVIRVD